MLERDDPRFSALGNFSPHVNLACRIMAYKNYSQTGRYADALPQSAYLLGSLLNYLCRKFAAIYDLYHAYL
ncbi:hypothetical protein ATE69_13510 [Sphingopyxis sp. H071]|nr:hypothetical protein ATE69_13510 [Sphingopyxis sp. H071]